MTLLCRQLNLLCKYGIRRSSSFPLKIKLVETSKTKSHISALCIVSSNHRYSTLQNEKTLKTIHLLNHRLPAISIASLYHDYTVDSVDKVKGLQSETQSAPLSTTAEVNDPTAPVVSSSELSAPDHAETVLSTGNLSENLALTSTDTLSVVDNVEVSLSSIGLGGWSPVGLVRQFIELLHVHLDLPWWTAIVLATLVARVLLFPVVVKAQQNAVSVANYMPQLQVLQAKFNRARRNGNAVEASRYGMELQLYMKEHKINPFKSALIPLIQAPVFVSFFLGLRSMANLPVESFKTGGISWITDLTVPDPYYITPLVTCATLYVVIKLGAESGIKLENMKLTRYVLSAVPIIILPFTINFPAAVLCYWCANNFFTLGAVSLLKVKRVRQALNIPTLKPIDPKFVPEKKGFIAGVKEAIEDQKMLQAVAERSRMDEISFKKAGTGPIPRTYSYDPTKPRPVAAAAARKAKEYKP